MASSKRSQLEKQNTFPIERWLMLDPMLWVVSSRIAPQYIHPYKWIFQLLKKYLTFLCNPRRFVHDPYQSIIPMWTNQVNTSSYGTNNLINVWHNLNALNLVRLFEILLIAIVNILHCFGQKNGLMVNVFLHQNLSFLRNLKRKGKKEAIVNHQVG